MNITSLYFVLFTLLGLVVYYVLPRRPQNYWLLLLSYIFCMTWAWQFAFILALLTLANFILAQRLHSDQRPLGFLWLGISLNVLALVFFRIANFFLPEALALLTGLGVSTEAGGLQFLIPIGLSYYILENISWLSSDVRASARRLRGPSGGRRR
jgi:D-alanyl-lipoteichoic acid acyltransferase DltB (MBOAT superfamily)